MLLAMMLSSENRIGDCEKREVLGPNNEEDEDEEEEEEGVNPD